MLMDLLDPDFLDIFLVCLPEVSFPSYSVSIVAVDVMVFLAIRCTESAIIAFSILLGTLLWLIVRIASKRTTLAFVLLRNPSGFHRFSCLEVSLLIKGVVKQASASPKRFQRTPCCGSPHPKACPALISEAYSGRPCTCILQTQRSRISTILLHTTPDCSSRVTACSRYKNNF